MALATLSRFPATRCMAEIMQTLEAALTAGSSVLMRHYGALESFDQKKSAIDLVTIADRESEAAVKRVIYEAFPAHQILAEESGEDYEGRGAEFRWVIDPLDGTTNFAHSFPMFAVSIAVESNGEVIAAGV